ncbi:MAG: beta-lactamase family protein [bacterium]|nr:beta-lactamase family protein [bacterium]
MQTDGLDEFLRKGGYTGVVLLSRGGDEVFAGAYGMASPRWGIPNTMDMRFDTASITKLFTAVAVLQLVGQQRLDLDASIHTYVDLAATMIPPTVTLRHLLTHSSGIADDADEEAGEDYAELWIDKPTYSVTQTRDFLPQCTSDQPNFAPEEGHRYCNCGYVLAGLAIEHAAGTSFREYAIEHVFGPAGMTRSGFFDKRDAEPDVAEGFDPLPDGRLESNIFKYPPIGSPDGGAHVTAADLIRFVDALRNGVLLTSEFTKEFFTPQLSFDDGTGQGFGLEFKDNMWWKEGINAGVSGILRHWGETSGPGVDGVVLSNTEAGAWPVIRELDRRAGVTQKG